MALPDPECNGQCSPRGYLWGRQSGYWLDQYYYLGVAFGLGAFVNRLSGRIRPPLLGSGGTVIPRQGDWIFLAPGGGRSYGILADGSLWGWGQGPIGDGTFNSYANPKKISQTGERWKHVATASTHTLAIKEDGSLWSWGSNAFGQLGNGNKYPDFTTSPRVLLSGSIEFINFPEDGVSIGNRDPQPITFQKSDGNDPGSGATAEYEYECRLTGGIYMSSGGSGYKSQPSVFVRPTGSTEEISPATFSISMKYSVASVAIEDGGSGYASDCVVVFSDGLRGDTAEGEPVFSNGVLTSISITRGGEYSSPPTVFIRGRCVTQAVMSPVLSGRVSGFSLSSGGAYTGRSLSISFSGGNPDAPATITGTPTFDTKITSINLTSGGSGYTSKADNPLKAKMGDFILGEAVLAPCSAATIFPSEDNAWENDTGTVGAFSFIATHPHFSVDRLGSWIGLTETSYSPAAYLVGFGREPTPLEVTFVGSGFHGVYSPTFRISLSQPISGVRGKLAVRIDWPEVTLTSSAIAPPTPSGSKWSHEGGRFGLFLDYDGQHTYGRNRGNNYNPESERWYVSLPIEPYGAAGLTSIVEETEVMTVVQTGTEADPASSELECSSYSSIFYWTGTWGLDYCVVPLVNLSPPAARAWQGLFTGQKMHGGYLAPIYSPESKVYSEYTPKRQFSYPAISVLADPASMTAEDGRLVGFRYTQTNPPTSYPTPTVLSTGDSACNVSAYISGGKCMYSLTNGGSGHRTEPKITVTTISLSPRPVNFSGQWKKVSVSDTMSAGILEDGTPMWWPKSGFFEPVKVGFGIEVDSHVSIVSDKELVTKFSTPENIDAILPQTVGDFYLTTKWLGEASSSFFWQRIPSHYGMPRSIYRLTQTPYLTSYNGTIYPDWVWSYFQMPCKINGSQSTLNEVTNIIPPWSTNQYPDDELRFGGIKSAYWHSPEFPEYSSEYLFGGTVDRNYGAYGNGSSCFTELPDLGGELSARLASPGACKDIFCDQGSFLVVSESGEVWNLSPCQKAAPIIGQPSPHEKITIKLHETRFTVKWEWELEDREVEVEMYDCGPYRPGLGDPSSACDTQTLKYKTLNPPSKSVIDEQCGWENEIEIYADAEFLLRLSGDGSGYCKEDSLALQFRGGRVLTELRLKYDPGSIEVETQSYSRDTLTADRYWDYYGNQFFYTQPMILFAPPSAEGNHYYGWVWYFLAGTWFKGGKTKVCGCGQGGEGYLSKGSIDSTAIKSLTWKDLVHRIEPIYIDLPDLEVPVSATILDGKVVALGVNAFSTGTYGLDYISTWGRNRFSELPTVELVSKSGSGSGAAVSVFSKKSVFAPPRRADDRCVAVFSGGNVRETGRIGGYGTPSVPTGSGFISSKNEFIFPSTYGENFSSAAGRCLRSESGKVYDTILDGQKPWPSPNLSVAINSPGGGYTLLPRIQVAQPSQKIATADVEFNGKLVSLGVDDGGFGYTSPPTLTIDGSGEGECVISGPVSLVEVTSGGSGYSHSPKVRFTGPGWPGKATCSLNDDGSVASVSVQDGGDYRSAPGVAFDPIPEVTSISISSGGSGYTSNPRVEIVGNCGGSGATATAKINGQVTAVEVTFGGSGYSSDAPPQVVFSGGGGSGAAATATVDDETGAVTGFEVTSGGSWYTSRPAVKLVGGAGRGASGRATIAGPVGSLTLTSGGRDYLEPPTVLFIGGRGDGATATATVGTRGGGATATTVINGSILYAHVTSQGSGYEYSPKVQISGGGNREISRLSSLLLEGEIAAEEYQKGVDAARGKIQSRIEGQVSAVNITNPGSGYVAASQLRIENYYPTVPYRTDSVWAAGATVRGAGYGGDESFVMTPNVPSCVGGGVSASAIPTKKYFQKPVFSMADAFTYYYGYYGNGVSVRVESVRGSKRTSRGLRAKKSFTKTLEALRTESASADLAAHSGACRFTNVTGKRVRNLDSTPVVYDKIDILFQRGGGGQGFDFRFSQLKFSESSPPKFEVYDKTGTGAVLQTSLNGSGAIDSITFTSDGSSYTNQHRLQVTGGRFRLVRCQATCNVDGQGRVTSITVASPGDGYLSPAVIVHGGGGSGCLATAFLQPGFLPRGVRRIVVDSGGGGYSQESPPSVYVAEFSPPFVETEFAKIINEKLLQSQATAWTGMTAEYAKDDDLPAFSSPTDYDFDSLVTPIFESGAWWQSDAKAIVDNFATFEYVETMAVDWSQRVPEPYSGNVPITVSGTCDTPLSLTATGVSWTKVFGQVDTNGGPGWAAAAIKT